MALGRCDAIGGRLRRSAILCVEPQMPLLKRRVPALSHDLVRVAFYAIVRRKNAHGSARRERRINLQREPQLE